MSNLQQAIWLDRKTISIPLFAVQADQQYQLVYSPDEKAIPLERLGQPGLLALPSDVSVEMVKTVVKGQLAILSGNYRTGLQIAGVLDDLFYFDGKLGPQFPDDPHENIDISVWAPTAQSVKLLLFRQASDLMPASTLPMIEANGVWSAEIENSWRDRYYLFSVKVYVPKLQQFVENVVTDPYSCDISLNGGKSRLTDLNDMQTKPAGWDQHNSPEIESNNDLTIWEVHVRDFSANDESVPVGQRGTYLAFTNGNSNGMRHLRGLAEAGLKAVHLLPTFHIASINEDKGTWKTTGDLSGFPPDGTQQQAAVVAIQNEDAFNWGYDPVHYMAPEGSYAVDPDSRVQEYRAMVRALHGTGLRVIQDQVFNHTTSNGQGVNSVFDKIVPGYYYRLDSDGNVRNASCCSDTASEHRMMEKLMVDCLVQNVKQYKIDGFRFDLMGFHFVSNMKKIQAALGEKIYLYGEGWDTPETANRSEMPNATQANLFGTGIGTFNDRMRDGIRGGNPFSDPREQGFASGWTGDPSQNDWIRASLAGNMREFSFLKSEGRTSRAGSLNYNGREVGYTASPVECVNFCSVHDNRILFDAIQIKAPMGESTAMRARRQVVALSFLALGQGIPFFHAGDELLRSKDMDQNSYNSGDWFNKIDFTCESNNWGTGLPVASENESQWPIMKPLLAKAALKPTSVDIKNTLNAFLGLLRVRYSSGLFRMRSLAEVQSNLSFVESEGGVIEMRLKANTGSYQGYQEILVVFNANTKDALVKTAGLEPHPAISEWGSFDKAGGSANVKALSTAVFVG